MSTKALQGASVNAGGTLIANKKKIGTGPVGNDSVDLVGPNDIPMKTAKAMGLISTDGTQEFNKATTPTRVG